MSTVTKIESNILNFLEKKLEDYNINGEKLKFIHGYIKEGTAEDKFKGVSKESDFPFVLIRPGEMNQSTRVGISERFQEFKILLAIKDGNEQGYRVVMELADEIVKIFTQYPSVAGSYSLVQDQIRGRLDEKLSVGDYWLYELSITAKVPVWKPKIL